jgi:hypothetical protein
MNNDASAFEIKFNDSSVGPDGMFLPPGQMLCNIPLLQPTDAT